MEKWNSSCQLAAQSDGTALKGSDVCRGTEVCGFFNLTKPREAILLGPLEGPFLQFSCRMISFFSAVDADTVMI